MDDIASKAIPANNPRIRSLHVQVHRVSVAQIWNPLRSPNNDERLQSYGSAFTVDVTTAATALASLGVGSRSLGTSVVPGDCSIDASHCAVVSKSGSAIRRGLGAKPSARLMA